MNLEKRYEQILSNFESLEHRVREQQNIGSFEFAFILTSILIMIPYELVTDARSMLVLGSLNLLFDLVFVLLLLRFISWKRQGKLNLFTVITDSLAALPGILAIVFLGVSLMLPQEFILGDFLAAGGLSLAVIRSAKLLRALRLSRLFRLLRNIKMLRYIALKSDSPSCESTVGWLGFFVLSILILINVGTTVWGPLAFLQDSSDLAREQFIQELETTAPADILGAMQLSREHGLAESIIYLERDGRRTYGTEYQNLDRSDAEAEISRRYNGLNSYLISAGGWQIRIRNSVLFRAQRMHNFLWITGIILSITLFSLLATSFIGRTYTDYLNDYRKAILDSYKGIESLFEIDPEQISRDDRDSFAYAIGLYTKDFLEMVRTYHALNDSLEEKEQEIADLNDAIQGLEKDLEPLDADLQACRELIQKLCRKNPGLADKISKRTVFQTFSLS
ncbi:hypothetical protein [Spirochaeta dissipatitropha]